MISTKELKEKFYHSEDHPYRIYEKTINSLLSKNDIILDAGCGRTTPILKKFIDKAKHCIGVDLEECKKKYKEIQYIKGDISKIDIKDNFVDIVISRAVLEHVENPYLVFKEINRILKPQGKFIFLIPNLGDYVSLFSLLIPEKYHGIIVSKTEGRKIDDVFPVFYKANTKRSIKKLCKATGFHILDFQYLGQYPSSFNFNPFLFLIGVIYEKITTNLKILESLRAWIFVILEKK